VAEKVFFGNFEGGHPQVDPGARSLLYESREVLEKKFGENFGNFSTLGNPQFYCKEITVTLH
jgi:hypothetical protein